jgi:hypothetical protein
LAAVYLYGYVIEMCLTAAYFRSIGFHANDEVDAEVLHLKMKQARQRPAAGGQPLMGSDPHPLVGWALLLQDQRRRAAAKALGRVQSEELRRGVDHARQAYRHWRPALRYKTVQARPAQFQEVRDAASWFLSRRGRF